MVRDRVRDRIRVRQSLKIANPDPNPDLKPAPKPKPDPAPNPNSGPFEVLHVAHHLETIVEYDEVISVCQEYSCGLWVRLGEHLAPCYMYMTPGAGLIPEFPA